MSSLITFLEAAFFLAALALIPWVIGYLVYREIRLRRHADELTLPKIHVYKEKTMRAAKQQIGGAALLLVCSIGLTAMPFNVYSWYPTSDYRHCVLDTKPLITAKIKWNNFRGTKALENCIYLVAREFRSIEDTRAWLLNNGYRIGPLREVSQTIMFVNYKIPAPGWAQVAERSKDDLKVRLSPAVSFLAYGLSIGIRFDQEERPVRVNAVMLYL